jgi:hypothetical protein
MKLTIGASVTFVDEHGRDRAALVTHVWPGMSGQADGCNLVVVSDDGARDDSYGRQIERKTSVPHQSGNAAPGYFWK